jgi:hypothetical protein
MIEARRNDRNWWTIGCPLFYRFGIWLVTLCHLFFGNPFFDVIIILIRLKQIDVIWLFVVINL